MPDIHPVSALATRWDDVTWEHVRPGVRRAAIGTPEMMIVMNELDSSMTPGPHDHDFDQIAYIVSGHATYVIGDVRNAVGPGSILVIPAGVMHHIEPEGDEPVLNLDVFAPARSDYGHLVEWMINAPQTPTEAL